MTVTTTTRSALYADGNQPRTNLAPPHNREFYTRTLFARSSRSTNQIISFGFPLPLPL